jgi:hypothetical protein
MMFSDLTRDFAEEIEELNLRAWFFERAIVGTVTRTSVSGHRTPDTEGVLAEKAL